jgi:hypothetical protein
MFAHVAQHMLASSSDADPVAGDFAKLPIMLESYSQQALDELLADVAPRRG